MPQIEPDRPTADKAVKKGFKKIRLRWWVSVILILIIVPVAVLSWNQYTNRGVSFTNAYEYQVGNAFVEQLSKGNYEKAYQYIDIDGLKQEWLEEWFDAEKLANIEQDGLAKFCEYGAKLDEIGGIESYEYVGISLGGGNTDGSLVYRLIYKIKISDQVVTFEVHVSDDGVEHFSGGGSFVDDPLAQFSIWSEYLWQDYEGCYFDPESGQYVYYEAE